MARFPSKEWCEEAVRLVNADPESVLAGKGWKGDFGLVIDAERGTLPRPFVIHCNPVDGKITGFQVLPDPDDLDELEPVYLIRAPYSIWRDLLLGTLDPIEALMKRRIQVRGDIQPLIERMKYKGIADRVFSQIQTEFLEQA